MISDLNFKVSIYFILSIFAFFLCFKVISFCLHNFILYFLYFLSEAITQCEFNEKYTSQEGEEEDEEKKMNKPY